MQDPSQQPLDEVGSSAGGATAASTKPLDEESLRNNMKILQYCHTMLSVVVGSCAGILGLTGSSGFVFYFLSVAFLNGLLLAKMGFASARYFPTKSILWTYDVFGGLMSYVLFWTLLSAVVYLY